MRTREAWVRRDLDAWKDEVRALVAGDGAVARTDPRAFRSGVCGLCASDACASRSAQECVHVGDSWHCTSPQLGQGANMALLDAFALARALETAEQSRRGAWGICAAAALAHSFVSSWPRCLFTPAYQSDSAAIAWLRDLAHVAALARAACAADVGGAGGGTMGRAALAQWACVRNARWRGRKREAGSRGALDAPGSSEVR